MPQQRFFPRLVCLATLLVPFTLHASEPVHVLTGTLGKSPIVVELNLATPDDINGRYFYEKYHKDLALSGKLQGQDLRLTEGLSYDENPDLPTLHLHKSSDSTWTGEWSSSKGKSFKVQLTEKTVAAPDASAEPGWQDIYRESAYDYLRLSQLKLKADKKETFMGHDLQCGSSPNQASPFSKSPQATRPIRPHASIGNCARVSGMRSSATTNACSAAVAWGVISSSRSARN